MQEEEALLTFTKVEDNWFRLVNHQTGEIREDKDLALVVGRLYRELLKERR